MFSVSAAQKDKKTEENVIDGFVFQPSPSKTLNRSVLFLRHISSCRLLDKYLTHKNAFIFLRLHWLVSESSTMPLWFLFWTFIFCSRRAICFEISHLRRDRRRLNFSSRSFAVIGFRNR